MSEKSKWQEEGECPECKKNRYAFPNKMLDFKEMPLVAIESGKINDFINLKRKTIRLFCNSCRTRFKWNPASGRITKAKK